MSWPVLPYGFLGSQGDSETDTYQVPRSLRFNETSKYLTRTLGTPTNNKIFTYSGWLKPACIAGSTRMPIFTACNSAATLIFALEFTVTTKTLQMWDSNYTSGSPALISSQVFRDPTAWLHIVMAVDTTQATAANRVKLYVNGAQITAFSSSNYAAQNSNPYMNSAVQHSIGSWQPFSGGNYDGYMAEVNFIDGQALTPSSFGETESVTGRWRPISYTGAYGVNSFYLQFSDNSAATATTLGKDFAPISGAHTAANNWTPNSFSVTAGVTNDSFVDSPTIYGTDTGVGGEVRGNYSTLNSLAGSGTTANGNLDFSSSGVGQRYGTIGIASGKWYWEVAVTAGSGATLPLVGIGNNPNQTGLVGIYAYYGFNGNKYADATATAYGAAYGVSDIIGIAFDATAGTLTFYKNNSSQGQAYSGISGTYFPYLRTDTGSNISVNFGQRPFIYAAPSGHKALCSTNFPKPAVQKSSTGMDVVTYTGTGATLTNSSLSFSPDLVWLKSRSAATDHALYDSVRGATFDLSSTSTAAETTQAQGLTSFNASGFTIGTLAKLNTTSATYVGWAWDETPTAGFDIVGYVGNGTSGRTISHNLGVAPKFIFVKNRTTVSDWPVYHASLAASNMLFLHLPNAAGAISSYAWGGVSAASSTTFTVIAGNTDIRSVNTTSDNYVAYCFAEVDGFSKFGSYTGNAAADGPFVYCGFRPRWVMVKNTTSAYSWIIYDTARSPENLVTLKLVPNSSQEENGSGIGGVALNTMDILANGFKLRSTNIDANQSGATYIFAAFAEAPFKYSRAR